MPPIRNDCYFFRGFTIVLYSCIYFFIYFVSFIFFYFFSRLLLDTIRASFRPLYKYTAANGNEAFILFYVFYLNMLIFQFHCSAHAVRVARGRRRSGLLVCSCRAAAAAVHPAVAVGCSKCSSSCSCSRRQPERGQQWQGRRRSGTSAGENLFFVVIGCVVLWGAEWEALDSGRQVEKGEY